MSTAEAKCDHCGAMCRVTVILDSQGDGLMTDIIVEESESVTDWEGGNPECKHEEYTIGRIDDEDDY